MARKQSERRRNYRKDKRATDKDAVRVAVIRQSGAGSDEETSSKKNSTKRRQDKRANALTVDDRPNDPNWYFTDAALADQVSRLAFQQLAGYPIDLMNTRFDVPNVFRILLNPAPGVIKSADYSSQMINKTSGINLAGFKLFSKLAAYTGRIATYGPQDISTMILAMGEIISCVEWIRRVFGVAYVMNMRNRSYPREVLAFGMLVDPDDLFTNLADYRMRFNTLITMINQLPIPQGITYFEKCAALYEKMYLDQPSSMAQTIIPSPFTTWFLDETYYDGGTVLRTLSWTCKEETSYQDVDTQPKLLSYYLNQLDDMVGRMLNSSSLQVVYTDLLNLGTKVGQKFWQLDYLLEGYTVFPEYNEHFLLQFHNATICGSPIQETLLSNPHVTPWNDVYPNPDINSLFYNPGWTTLSQVSNGSPRTGTEAMIDTLTDNPSVEDMVEVTRYTAVSGQKYYGSDNKRLTDGLVPDHYIVSFGFHKLNGTAYQRACANNNMASLVKDEFPTLAGAVSTLDWCPQLYEVTSNGTPTGARVGDLNFYTVASAEYLRRVHQFMTLGLYDIRTLKE